MYDGTGVRRNVAVGREQRLLAHGAGHHRRTQGTRLSSCARGSERLCAAGVAWLYASQSTECTADEVTCVNPAFRSSRSASPLSPESLQPSSSVRNSTHSSAEFELD